MRRGNPCSWRPSSASTASSRASTTRGSFVCSTTALTSSGPTTRWSSSRAGYASGRASRLSRSLPALRDIATSLALLHARRLIHRDLSPSNIRMTADGHCKLLDFGALTSFGTTPLIVGTPRAVPPEAPGGRFARPARRFAYALGALAYWVLTRRHAYPARRIQERPELWKHAPSPPSSHAPSIPRELDLLVLSLLSTRPSRASGERGGSHLASPGHR